MKLVEWSDRDIRIGRQVEQMMFGALGSIVLLVGFFAVFPVWAFITCHWKITADGGEDFDKEQGAGVFAMIVVIEAIVGVMAFLIYREMTGFGASGDG